MIVHKREKGSPLCRTGVHSEYLGGQAKRSRIDFALVAISELREVEIK